MAKNKDVKPEGDEPEGEDAQPAPKKGLFAKKKLLLIGAAALVLVLGGGAAAYIFLFGGAKSASDKQAMADAQPVPLVPPKVVFYDVPDIVVNIQSPDGNPAYLKLSLSLELKSADEQAGLKVLMPRIVDQFQSYLRELRVDDLKGSASVTRVKEELLRRINVAAAPYRVEDVLLKEMIVQ